MGWEEGESDDDKRCWECSGEWESDEVIRDRRQRMELTGASFACQSGRPPTATNTSAFFSHWVSRIFSTMERVSVSSPPPHFSTSTVHYVALQSPHICTAQQRTPQQRRDLTCPTSGTSYRSFSFPSLRPCPMFANTRQRAVLRASSNPFLVFRSSLSLSSLGVTSNPFPPFLPSAPHRHFGYHSTPPRSPILPSSLVTIDYVYNHLPRLKLLDGSWHMPSEKRNPQADFEAAHLPNAQRFDVDGISDHSTSLPHMLPSVKDFTTAMGKLGVQSDDPIVVYDTKGVFSAARVWYTLRCFGARDVAVMQGGLPLWLHHRLPTESGPAHRTPTSTFIPIDRTSALIRSFSEVLANTRTPSFQVLDARSRGRFTGEDPEPRPGLSSGHIPGSVNVPYSELVEKAEGGGVQLKSVEELVRVMRAAGVRLNDRNSPLVTSCGTGVTASVVALALELIGHRAVSLYDGSWTEWAQMKDAPIVKGKAGEEKKGQQTV